MAHTPLPWRIVPREQESDGSWMPRAIVGGSRDLDICLLESATVLNTPGMQPYVDSDAMVEADGTVCSKADNGNLLLAAPTLLRTMETINRLASPGNRTLDELIRALDYIADSARAAIAKATGK